MIIFVLIILFFSIILHEVSHGVVALWNGDPTAKERKRLTLNPVSHVDLLGTLAVPFILALLRSPMLFGWAKPVPFNPLRFRHLSFGVFSVSIAGPLTNLLLAFLFSLALRLELPVAWRPLFYYGASINVMLAIFNLLPIPPLDGSKVLAVSLPQKWRGPYLRFERWGILVLFVLMYFGWLEKLILPAYRLILGKMVPAGS